MPIYEYTCENCGKVIEKFKRINDESDEYCNCGGKLHKLISNSNFILKGGGWYSSGYSKEPAKS